MSDIIPIVVTGGPCGGKTEVKAALLTRFGNEIVAVPEVATLLLNAEDGFPMPGRDLPWSEAWQARFQEAIASLQVPLEEGRKLLALERGAQLLLCDRGLLDGAAYTPGGVAEFSRRYGVDIAAAHARYRVVLHLESLATYDLEKYGREGNDKRFEPLERAQMLERATRAVWQGHPRWIFVPGHPTAEEKIAAAVAIVENTLNQGR